MSDGALHHPGGQTLAAHPDEQRIVRAAPIGTAVQAGGDSGTNRRQDRHHPLFTPLAVDHQMIVGWRLADIQGQRLADAQPSAVKQRQQSGVTDRDPLHRRRVADLANHLARLVHC